ncbi:DNA translocase FtsK [Perspicuibacillus lycopersici]|uniref:DNA translocase FtsK n=1 Tax=Perspicuibacillus lycopersici TaxID=1325689 RepID=UPI00295542AD|nr:DNA translocase FtsK [Perspicuibacillus lycopersici]
MDWKKWFSFHNEDEKREEHENTKNTSHKEMETRIAYQYPKGKYSISMDTDIEERKKRVMNSRTNASYHRGNNNMRGEAQEINKLLEKRREKRLDQPLSHPLVEEIDKQTEEPLPISLEKNKEIVKQQGPKRPFRPTEIPSPIYGFKPRKRQRKEIVEYELTTFTPEAKREESREVPNTVFVPESAYENIAFRNINKKEQEIMGRKLSTESFLDDTENRTSVLEETAPPIDFEIPVETTQSSMLSNTKEHETEAVTKIEYINDNPIAEESPESIMLPQDDGENRQTNLPSVALDSKVEELPAVAEQIEQKQEEQVDSLPIVEESNFKEEAPHPRRERKHVPFNVLMLKKDRESLQRKTQENNVPIKHKNNRTLSELAATVEEKPQDIINRVESRENREDDSINKHLKEMNAKDLSIFGNEQIIPPLDNAMPVEANTIAAQEKTLLVNAQRNYQFAEHTLLEQPIERTSNEGWLNSQAEILNNTLHSFNVGANVVSVSEGPTVTRFEVSPDLGVKVNKITNLTDDLKLSLAAKDIRMEAPIPGKHTIGIEVPNKVSRPVYLREIIDQDIFTKAESPLTVALGLDIAGKPVITDLKKMPHGLIAGATGSGKSVCINTFIVSLLYKARPDEVKLLLIDPKMVELAPYNDIPHLISPVITDVKAATASLKWAVEEMERRYELFAAAGVREIGKYNEKDVEGKHQLPYIVIIIDELADLMMVAPADVEEAICRIAQKARACGIHLLIATQRPSVDVITGLIKANVPTRIAFSVSSQIDSRTIIDISGAERLLGKGDMLFLDNGTSKPTRLQGPFISDEEIEKVVEHVRGQGKPQYLFEQEELIKKSDFSETDELLLEACEFAFQQGNISTSSLQRHFRIGYNRAARLIELMEDKGMITESKGSKPRDVLLTEQDLEELQELM